MSAAHQNKKAHRARVDATILANWEVGKKRKVDGVVYLTRKDARIARANKRRDAAALAA